MGELTLEEKKARLKEQGILVTIQRSAILEFLQDNTHHPTAEEIYRSLRGIYPALSRATIYNALDLFKQHGLVQEINIERNKAHYDYKIEPHHHFLCRHCSRIYDVDMEKIPWEKKDRLNGHRIEEVWLYVIGTCVACLREDHDAGAP